MSLDFKSNPRNTFRGYNKTLLLLFNQTVVIPRGSRIQRIRTDKGGQYTSNELDTSVSRRTICTSVLLTRSCNRWVSRNTMGTVSYTHLTLPTKRIV